jgi:hypothetical protein
MNDEDKSSRAAFPVGQVTLFTAGVPPVATGWVWVQSGSRSCRCNRLLLVTSTEKKPVPSGFTTYLPVQSKVTSQVWP